MGNLHRKRKKERQLGRKEAGEAWVAAERQDLDEAERFMRRALEGHEDDCVLWNDLGVILWRREKLRESEKAFRNALLIRPEYEDAKMNLAALLSARGFYRQALRLEEELARGAPARREYHERRAAECREAIRRLEETEPQNGPQTQS
jgi:Flp pilus assembly protein TadD